MNARELLEIAWDGTLPVDPIAIAKKLDIEVGKFANDELGDISGLVARNDGKVTIHVSPSDATVRQRFTIAHELGHFALGHLRDEPHFRDTSREFMTGNSDPLEIDANRFAAQLLMPGDAVRERVRQMDKPDVRKLAREFAVSEAAMRFRLINLGIIEND